MYKKYFVIDTNVILEDANSIFTLSKEGENLIIIPETVLDEIDNKKSGFDEINYQARAFGRILESMKIRKSFSRSLYNIVDIVDDKNRVIEIISKENYDIPPNRATNIINDRKILEIAKFAKEYYKDVIFISFDMMARMRAVSYNIKTMGVLEEKSEFDFEFFKELNISFENSSDLNNQPIKNYNPNHKPYNFCYQFNSIGTKKIALGVIQNNHISIIDEKKLSFQAVPPLNREQKFLSFAIIEPFFDVVIVEAKAGSGKTLLAISGAMKLLKQKLFNKIIYIRNSIESLDKGEDIGYLPGLEEKFAIYNHPLHDSLEFIVKQEYRQKKENKRGATKTELEESEVPIKIEEYILKYSIETMWVGEMRGRTLSEAVVIIDEAQNISNKTMQMLLSRLDKSCKVIILGSNKQIDNFYINKYTNSLTTLLKSTKKSTPLVNIFAITLSKVLRGPITEWAENLFGGEGN